jgi:hypothetical protein
VVLVLCLVVDAFALLVSATMLTVGPGNTVDTAFYLLTLGVLLPAALLVACRTAATVRKEAGPSAVSALGAWAAVALLVILLVSRVARFAGVPSSVLLLPLAAAWMVGLLLAVRSVRGDGTARAWVGAGDARRAWSVAAVLGCASVLAFLSPEVFGPVRLAISVGIAAALSALHVRRARSPERRRWPLLVDAGVLALVVLTVTDVWAYLEYQRDGAPTYVLGDGLVFSPEILAFAHRLHAGFWLGPVNDVLHGRALLVEASSQYGVGSLYFLAAFFKLAPIGYGPLALVSSVLTGLQYALAYGVMRLAGCPRTLAVPAIAAAVVGLVLGSIGSPADFPSTGGMRFGIPWLVVGLTVLAARWPRPRRPIRGAAVGVVAISSVWSFETFFYTGAAFAAVAAFEAAALGPGEQRIRALVRYLALAAGACAVAHVVLAVGTRVFAGAWPDWTTYLAFLRAYAIEGELYRLTVDPWSPGLPIFLLLVGSGVALAALLARRRELVLECRPGLVAIAGSVGLGVASISYFVGHSHPNTLMYPALPALVAGCVGASVIERPRLGAPRAARLLAVAVGLWVAALLAISGWPDATQKWRRTALAHAVPGAGHGGSIAEAAARLWRSPPSDARAPEAEALLARRLPSGAPALVLLEPELTVETLVRGGRVNVLPIGHPEQENLVPQLADPRVLRSVERLAPGTLMLVQPDQLDAPVKALLALPSGRRKLVRVQRLALERIAERFRLETVERGPSGLALVRLRARQP